MTRLMNATEVGELLRMDRATVLRRVQQQRLSCVRDGRKILFKEEHVAAYLAANEVLATPPQVPARPSRYGR
jgi:excisionase family DNA binding protein